VTENSVSTISGVIKLLRGEVGQKPPMLRRHGAVLPQPAPFRFALPPENTPLAHSSHKIPVAIVYRRGYIALMDKQNMTSKEAATRLGTAGGRIRQLVLAGGPTARQLGRDLMVRASDLAGGKVYGTCGRPLKVGADGGGSTATNAPVQGRPLPGMGRNMAQRTWKKAMTKAGKR